MQHQEGYFDGVNQTKIYYQSWLPAAQPKAVLLVVHGLGEHSGRYMNVVNHFVPLGYAVYALDHVGHGKSEGTRKFVQRFSDYTSVLKQYFDMVSTWQPALPIFLVGHSLGGLISAVYLLDYQAGLAGAVLSGPAVKVPSDISPITIQIGKVLSMLFPKAGILGLDASGISRDPAVVAAYNSDPLVYRGKITARLGAEMLASMQRVATEAHKINLPLLLLQGSADRLVDPTGASFLHGSVTSQDKTLRVYESFYHEVFNEPEHQQVLDEMEAWVEAHR